MDVDMVRNESQATGTSTGTSYASSSLFYLKFSPEESKNCSRVSSAKFQRQLFGRLGSFAKLGIDLKSYMVDRVHRTL